MYIFINKGLGMSPGKIAAQAGHAAVEATLLSHPELHPDDKLIPLWDNWREGGHYVKYVMEARDEAHMRNIADYLEDRGFRHSVIIDEGRTEIPAMSITAIGVALVDKDDPHTAATFSSFSLYKDARPPRRPVAPIGIGIPETGGGAYRTPDYKAVGQPIKPSPMQGETKPVHLFGYPTLLLLEVDGEQVDCSESLILTGNGMQLDLDKLLTTIDDFQQKERSRNTLPDVYLSH
jgi:PTH2 family peptidyl-tRNA hydrolase